MKPTWFVPQSPHSLTHFCSSVCSQIFSRRLAAHFLFLTSLFSYAFLAHVNLFCYFTTVLLFIMTLQAAQIQLWRVGALVFRELQAFQEKVNVTELEHKYNIKKFIFWIFSEIYLDIIALWEHILYYIEHDCTCLNFLPLAQMWIHWLSVLSLFFLLYIHIMIHLLWILNKSKPQP